MSARKPRRVDHAAKGYRLGLADAAAILDVPTDQVVDYVRASGLPTLVVGDGNFAPLGFRFQHDDLVVLAEELRTQMVHTDVRNRARVQAALRAYLDDVPAERDYDRALLANSPLWTSTRLGEALCVRVPALVLHHKASGQPPITESMARAALEYVRAVAVRGVIPAADRGGAQRWGHWYRLPEGFAPGSSEDEQAVGLLLGSVEPGEKVVRRGRGPATLADPVTPVAESD